jgi:hypothetical protein
MPRAPRFRDLVHDLGAEATEGSARRPRGLPFLPPPLRDSGRFRPPLSPCRRLDGQCCPRRFSTAILRRSGSLDGSWSRRRPRRTVDAGAPALGAGAGRRPVESPLAVPGSPRSAAPSSPAARRVTGWSG